MHRDYLTLNAYQLNFSYQIGVNLFCIPENFKPTFKTGFWVQKHLLNLCSNAVDSQRLLCNQKAVVKCLY